MRERTLPTFATRPARGTSAGAMDSPQRVVLFRPRTVAQVAGVLLGLAVALWVVWVSMRVITWVLVALFLALALEPGVRFLQDRGMKRRGAAAVLAALLVPPLVDEVDGLADAAPGYVEDITAGRGPLGFLQTDYQIVDRVRQATESGGGSLLGGGARTVLNVGHRISQTVSGYVTGNLLLSVIAGVSSTIALLIMGVPFALELGLVVAVLDLIPLAGATLAGLLLTTVGFLTSVTAGIVLLVFFVLYQQLENHVLQPLVYGRTVQLSPLVVLIAILIGSEVAGVLGALAAIPVAGTLQILLRDWLEHRRMRRDEGGASSVAAEAVVPHPDAEPT